MPNGKTPWFRFYPGDWLSSRDNDLIGPLGEGAYIRLLCYEWLDPDCSLPADDEELAALSRLGEQWTGKVGQRIRSKFREVNGKLYNERLLTERSKLDTYQKSQSEHGKRGMEKRWRGHNKPITSLSSGHNEPITSRVARMSEVICQMSEEENTLPTLPLSREGNPGWERFKAEYPGNPPTDWDCQVFLSVIVTSADEALLFENLGTWRECRQWRDGCIPSAENFLRKRIWKTRPKEETALDAGQQQLARLRAARAMEGDSE